MAKLLIEKDRLIFVYKWVDRKMRRDGDFPYSYDWVAEDFDSSAFYEKVNVAREHWKRIDLNDRFGVEEWCNSYLDQAQLKQLGNAARNAAFRKRQKLGDGLKSITISHRAWYMLSELAKSDGATLSEALISRLEDEWLNLPVGS